MGSASLVELITNSALSSLHVLSQLCLTVAHFSRHSTLSPGSHGAWSRRYLSFNDSPTHKVAGEDSA